MLAVLIIFLILLLIALLRVGAALRLEEGVLHLKIIAGPVKFELLPKKERKPQKAGGEGAPKKKEKKKKVKKKKEKEKKGPESPEGGKEKKKLPITWDLISEILTAVGELLGRLRRKLCIDKLTIHYTVSSPDPYSTAMTFAYASIAVNALTPVLDNTFKIKERDLGAAVDFNSGENVIFVEAQLTIAIWEIVYIALAVVPAVKAIIRGFKKGKVENNGQASNQ